MGIQVKSIRNNGVDVYLVKIEMEVEVEVEVEVVSRVVAMIIKGFEV